MSAIPPYRTVTKKTFRTKFGPKSSANFEKRIWIMCKSLSKESDLGIKEIYITDGYEKIGQLMGAGGRNERSLIVKDIKNKTLGWDSCFYDEYRKQLALNISDMAAGVKIEKGEFDCHNKDCKSKECYFYTSQTCSADEAATLYIVCTKCNSRFRM